MTIAEQLQEQITELGHMYWEGKENFFIRYWIYLDRGLDVFNKFKYYLGLPLLAAGIFPFLKGHWVWLASITLGGLPFLIIAGRYQLQKINKTTQYVNSITGDIFQFKPMQLSIEQVNLLKEISTKLDKLNDTNKRN